jgi:hypothetical protein
VSEPAPEANGNDDASAAAEEADGAAAAEPVAQEEPQQYVCDEDDAEDELTLVDQELTSLPAEIIRARGATLRRIDLSMNKLSSLASLGWPYGGQAWPALEELILDKNQLSTLTGLGPGPLPKLRTLWLNNNAIEDLDALLAAIEKVAPNLSYLSMLRNPVAPDSYFSDASAAAATAGGVMGSGASGGGGDSGMESYARFRLYVCYRLKQLAFLDATPVSPDERKEANLRGQYCRVAKPQAPKAAKGAVSPTAAAGAAAGAAAAGGEDGAVSPDSAAAARQSQVGVSKDAKPPKVATFLAKGKPRYDGTNSEGNRFIMNDDL